MAYYNQITHKSDLVERILGATARFFQDAAERRALRRTYVTTLNELNSLSMRELADLGMHHSELKRIAWEATYGTPKH